MEIGKYEEETLRTIMVKLIPLLPYPKSQSQLWQNSYRFPKNSFI